MSVKECPEACVSLGGAGRSCPANARHGAERTLPRRIHSWITIVNTVRKCPF